MFKRRPLERRAPFLAKCHKNLEKSAGSQRWAVPEGLAGQDASRAELPHAGAPSAPRGFRYVRRMSDSPTAASRIGSTIAVTLILLLPALWNRFPLLEFDTGGYLARWFEGYLVPARSTTYGLMLAAAWPLDFWPVVVAQAAAAVWVIGLVLRIQRFNLHPVGLLAIVAALSVTTALPFLASTLLTDIFAGLAVLALYALLWHSDRIGPGERTALVIFIGIAGSTHSATYAVLLALSSAALVLSLVSAKLVARRAVARAGAAMVLGAAMLLAGNYVVSKSLAWTPGGYGLAFGRMLQDGIVTRYLKDHCPDPHLRLCPYRSELPSDADEFLWGNGVFNRLGRFAGLGDEMRTIVLESMRDYPVMQLKAALVATAKQLVTVGTGEGVVDTMWHTYGIIGRYTPSVVPAMRAARQQHGEIGFEAINDVHVLFAWAAMALLPVMILLGFWSSEFADLGALAATTAVALLANAAVCGIISNPHDRYGSRIVWIAVFAVALVAWRAFPLVRERLSARLFRRESASTV